MYDFEYDFGPWNPDEQKRKEKVLWTLVGLSLTVSSDVLDSDVLFHCSDVPTFASSAEDNDLGTLSSNSPESKYGPILRSVEILTE